MSGSTYKWLGGSNGNLAGTEANWLIWDGSAFVAASNVPTSGDTITIDGGALVDDTAANWAYAPQMDIVFGSGGGTLEFGDATTQSVFDPGGTVTASFGNTGEVVLNDVTVGATLAAIGGTLTLDNLGTNTWDSLVWSAIGGNILLNGTGTARIEGGVLATSGGAVTIDVAQAPGAGILVASTGSFDIKALLQYGTGVLFAPEDGGAASGTVTLDATGSEEIPVYGFQSGDTIVLAGLTLADTTTSFANNVLTLVDGANTVELNFLGEFFDSTSFTLGTLNASGGVVITAPSVHATAWKHAESGNWNTASLWTNGVPTSSSYALITNIGTEPGASAFASFVVSATSASVGSVALAAPLGTLSLDGFTAAKGIYDIVGFVTVEGAVSAKFFGGETGGAALAIGPSGSLGLSGGSPIANNGTVALLTEGQVTIDGGTLNAAASASSGGADIIGWFGSGAQTVAKAGAQVSVNYTALGFFGASSGTLTIDGATWSDTGVLGGPHAGSILVGGGEINPFNSSQVLAGGTGTLVIQNGGQLNDQNAAIGAGSHANGTAYIMDGAVWNITGSLDVADTTNASGTIFLLQTDATSGTGGTLLVGGELTLGGQLTAAGTSVVQAGSLVLTHAMLEAVDTARVDVGSGTSSAASGIVIGAGSTVNATYSTLSANALISGLLSFTGNDFVYGNVAGTGTIVMAAGTLTFANSGTFDANLAFAGSGGTDLIVTGVTPSGLLGGFVPTLNATNTLVLSDLLYDASRTLTYDSATGLLTLAGPSLTAVTLHTDAGLSQGDFSLLSYDTGGGTYGTEILATPCYAAGTRLATPGGEVAVEHLRAGDFVLVRAGEGDAPRPVHWVGRFTIDLRRHPRPQSAAPVRIRAHAFAEGVPHRDLLVSPDHALFVDGVLMQAQALLNGASVAQEFPQRVTYFHVELAEHAVLLAEGLPAESYLDTGNRAVFDGQAGPRPLHPELASAAVWDARSCAPLVLGGARIARTREALEARLSDLGFVASAAAEVRLFADGRPLALTDAVALVPAGTQRLRIVSRSLVPAWRGLDDRRRLGVAVTRVRLGGRRLPARAFGAGWYAPEGQWRWTDGDAWLTPPPVARPTRLTLEIADLGALYWAREEPAGERAAVAANA
jgi:collagen type I alpha